MNSRYEILGIIGEGAYGTVLKARKIETNEIVAIKRLKDSDEDDYYKKTIYREIRILKHFKHEYIVNLQEAFKHKNKLYLVMDYCENNLLDLLDYSPHGLDFSKIQSILWELLQALKYLHENNITHRDIKPENILIHNNVVKLCDFGFARAQNKTCVNLTEYVATRWYRSPELLIGAKYTNAVDIWAVGCVFAEMVTGEPLFPGDSELDMLSQVCSIAGSLIPEHIDLLKKNPIFANFIIKHEGFPYGLRSRMNPIAFSLLVRLLDTDPDNRITAAQALQHPYFMQTSSVKNEFIRISSMSSVGTNRFKVVAPNLEMPVLMKSSLKQLRNKSLQSFVSKNKKESLTLPTDLDPKQFHGSTQN
eukprot:TRINITY_DN2249_c0_g1_i1.p1 TRINITY_DN2249_c0_g1~~TRINITY_DN2249_c0_g1_i1.p1  ORF type:complete len:362 (-),score=76.50 TRINITY_DN2249_c0_g1_i1:164-1249(-)